MMHSAINVFRYMIIGYSLLLLQGCLSDDRSDLEAQINQIMTTPGGRIEPLPEMKPVERFLYQTSKDPLLTGDAAKAVANRRRDPFESFVKKEIPEQLNKGPNLVAVENYNRECLTRNHEELEQFELDSLRMVGTLNQKDELWGIIADKGGTVYRVRTGYFIGKNCGKITKIGEDQISIKEKVKDSQGNCCEDREASLALLEETGTK